MRKRKYSHLKPESVPESQSGPESNPVPTVHNIVATSQIVGEGGAQQLDLNKIHEMLPFSFYDQRKFAAITVWLHRPVCTTLLFSSGKLVVTGCRTWYQCVYASMVVAGLLNDCMPGRCFSLQACDVQNIVAHVEVPVHGQTLDLQAMYSEMALNCTYQRKMFPGLIYRPESSPVVLLCFYSGKVVITGGKNMGDVYNGWRRLWPTIRRFITPPSAHTDGQDGDAALDGLPLVRDPAAEDAGRAGQGLVEHAGSGGGREQEGDLAHPPELQGLSDDLAAKRQTLSL
jgi:transcription initiation factor TFIID TATA-box-binding protein